MPELRRVLAPCKRHHFEGGEFWLASIELWDDETIVHFAMTFERADARELMQRLFSTMRPTPMSGEFVYEGPMITDDRGTTYAWSGAGGGGSARTDMFECHVGFGAAVPDDATVLAVDVPKVIGPHTFNVGLAR